MRLSILILITITYTKTFVGQTFNETDSLISRLYNEISTSYNVESKKIGCYGNLSTLYKKVDTLKQTVGLETFVNYFNDPSVNLKYYAFIEILALDDKLAFEKLLDISSNTDIISFEFAGQFRGKVKLLELLTGEYLGFIKMKYYYGIGCTYHGRTYLFGNKDRRAWRRNSASVENFVAVNGLSKKWIENYCR